ncbi:MAG TPA: hypothetical protein VGJ05_21255 [Fimbriiglobus sp.]
MVPLLLAWITSLVPPGAYAGDKAIRAAVVKALVPLEAGAAGHIEKKTCFACHNQTYPTLAFATARSRGLAVADAVLKDQADHVSAFLTEHRDEFRSGKGTGGQADSAGAALLVLELAGYEPDETTAAVVHFLLVSQPGKDHWSSSSSTRPPTEVSSFTTTCLAVRGLKTWQTKDQKATAKKRIDAARGWLTKATPADTEDRVFRLLGLQEAGATKKDVAAAAFDLLGTQRPDGGWGQTKDMASDPYATGTALYALHSAGGLKTAHPAYRAGVKFLLAAQRADGTWLVHSRSKPFQPYYESGFPHGKDQFISSSASGWAAAALALALPEK